MGLVSSSTAVSAGATREESKAAKKVMTDTLDLRLKEAQLQLEEAQRKRATAEATLADVLRYRKMKAAQEAEQLRIYRENPLFSNYLADSWDLNLPYEHFCLYFSIAGVLLNGIPSATEIYRAWRITKTSDEALRTKYAHKLYLTAADLPSIKSPEDGQRFIMRYARAGKIWGLYVPLFWVLYLRRAGDIAYEKRWMKERYDWW